MPLDETGETEPSPDTGAANATERRVDTLATAAAVEAILSGTDVADPVDRGILERASAFCRLSSGAEEVSVIAGHASDVAMVIAGYEMNGAEVPKAIDNLYATLTAAQCRWYCNAVRAELRNTPPNREKILKHMALALDAAKVLAKGYNDGSLQQEVDALQQLIHQL